jgi:hypothetical protein
VNPNKYCQRRFWFKAGKRFWFKAGKRFWLKAGILYQAHMNSSLSSLSSSPSWLPKFALAVAEGGWCMKTRVLEFATSQGYDLLSDPLIAGYLAGSSLASPDLISRLCTLGAAAGNPTYADEAFWAEIIAADVAHGRPELPARPVFEVIQTEQWETPYPMMLTLSLGIAEAVAAAFNASADRASDGRSAYVKVSLIWDTPPV